MGLRRSRRVFTHNSFECVSQFLCSQPCHAHLITFPTQSRWLKILSWRKKRVAWQRSTVPVRGTRRLVNYGSSSGTVASSVGADTGRATVCYRADQNPHVAGKQQRIGGHSSGNDHSANRDNSRLSLANAQGKPTVRQGHHSKHLRR